MRKPSVPDAYEYAKIVSDAYLRAEPADPVLWRDLLWNVHREFMYCSMSCALAVVGHDPYLTADHMRTDVKSHGVLLISAKNIRHPVWTDTDNILFRFVHDYLGHIRGGHDFGIPGEIFAYESMAKNFDDSVLPALFTEVVAQACVKVTTGTFPKQRLVILDGLPDYKRYLQGATA
jgi:hypothetical protein